jgi:hypothetical protein
MARYITRLLIESFANNPGPDLLAENVFLLNQAQEDPSLDAKK